MYGGLQEISVRDHRRLLQEACPYDSSLQVRIWTGSSMTASHKHRIDPTQDKGCPCGADLQDLQRLMYHCPLQEPLPLDLEPWRDMQPCHSAAILCPLSPSADMRARRRLACSHAMKVLSATPRPSPSFDWRNHCVMLDSSHSYAYCLYCHVVRRAKDNRHIATKVCEPRHEGAAHSEGDYTVHNMRCYRLTFRQWKRTVRRPALTCAFCGTWNWATNSKSRAFCPLSGF